MTAVCRLSNFHSHLSHPSSNARHVLLCLTPKCVPSDTSQPGVDSTRGGGARVLQPCLRLAVCRLQGHHRLHSPAQAHRRRHSRFRRFYLRFWCTEFPGPGPLPQARCVLPGTLDTLRTHGRGSPAGWDSFAGVGPKLAGATASGSRGQSRPQRTRVLLTSSF